MFTRKDEFTYRKEIEELRMALGNKEKECRLRIRDEALDHKNAALVMRAEHQNEMHNLRGEQMVKLLEVQEKLAAAEAKSCLLYTSPSPRDRTRSRMPSSA